MNLKILILIRDDITDRKTWSGVPKHIKTILEDSGNQIDFIHKLGFPDNLYIKVKNKIREFTGRKKIYYP